MKRLLGAAAAAIALTFASGAVAATVLDFEDINGAGYPIPTHYAGLQYEGIHVTSPQGAYGYGVAQVGPGARFAVNDFGNPAAILTGTGSFDFISGYFTAAFRDGMTLTLTGYQHAAQAYQQSFTVDTYAPLLVALNWTGLTRLEITTTGGVPRAGSTGYHVAFDALTLDLTNVTGVPEPATWAMMIAGFGMVGTAVRRRSNRRFLAA